MLNAQLFKQLSERVRERMPKLLILKGLPASGKSTLAKDLERKGWKVVEKDRIRKIVSGSETTIKNQRDLLISEHLKKGKNVVSSDTNLNPEHVPHLIKLAKECGAEVEVRVLDTPLNECIKRDKERDKTLGAGVITGMYNKYIR